MDDDNILDFQKAKFYQDHAEKSKQYITEIAGDFYERMEEMCQEARSSIRENHWFVTKDTWSNSADLVIVGLLTQYLAHWLIRFVDLFEKESPYKLTPDQLDSLACDLLMRHMRDARAVEKAQIEKFTEQFVDRLREASLTMKLEEKEKNLKVHVEQLNEKLMADNNIVRGTQSETEK